MRILDYSLKTTQQKLLDSAQTLVNELNHAGAERDRSHLTRLVIEADQVINQLQDAAEYDYATAVVENELRSIADAWAEWLDN